ncbi:MAG: fluoride efflux transporter CrcB [Bacteroidaceae bacterium]|nr:fluoride efflux transporter CrcB [Bacteroidaceae bacterium]
MELLKAMIIAGAGGFAGTCLRYLTGVLAKQWCSGAFPLGTFIVNALGCLIIGIVYGLSERSGALNSNHVLLLATGFCGGFTTFSAFANEAWTLGTKGDMLMSVLYVAASIVVGIVCVWAGRIITEPAITTSC